MPKSLKQTLKQHYEDQSLSPKQLQRLQNVEQKSWWLPAAAGFAVAAGLAALAVITLQSPSLQGIADEVAYNHLKNMPAEVLTSDYQVLNQALDRLDFQPIASQVLGASFELIGGRYCSIQGSIAAQLRLKHKETHQVYTLYQFRSLEVIGKGPPQSMLAKQTVKVELWREQGLGFALAIDR